jgi:hypothetical protein
VITINGKNYEGDNVTVINGQVIVDGKQVSGEVPDTVLTIKVDGIIKELHSDRSVRVYGKVEGDVHAKGSVNCDEVGGNVHAGGSVNCNDVNGSVSSGGSVNADNIAGSVTAGGSVRV